MSKILVKCLLCNKEESIHKSRVKNYKTCSKKCLSLFLKKHNNCKCFICNKEMYVKPFRLKRVKNITCSKECVNKLKSVNYRGRNNPNTKYYMIKDNMFKTINSEEKAYALGWIASDGSLHENGSITIQIHEKDKECLIKLSKIFSDDIDIKNDLEKHQVILRICSIEMMNDICNLLQIKPGKKSNLVCFPELNDDALGWAFLRGYFDGDGNIHKITEHHSSPSCNISSASLNMLNSIKNFCNIPCTLDLENNRIFWYSNNCLDFLGKLYSSNSNLRLERKYNQYLDISTWIPTYSNHTSWKNDFFKWTKSRKDAIAPSKERISDSGYDLTLLEKIKQIGDVELYDTGIKIVPKYGYYFDLVPRSSIIKSGYILANSIGIIDRTYLGNIMVPLIKIDKNAPDLILPNRLVQLIPRQIIHADLIEISESELEQTSRGEGGFGSSNK